MEPLELDDPATVGPYRLIARLGAGGMGRVYLARSAGGRTVAVKVVRADLTEEPGFRARFRFEAEAAQAVDGAYTAPVLDADPDAELPWLATEYILGPSLAEAIADHGPLPASTVAALGAGLAEALIAIHAAGLVHRDLKPSNILLSTSGPRVIDFGIARVLEGTRLTTTGVVVGSPGFMSPEQASDLPVGTPSDVFALGSVLLYAATGHGPFGSGMAAAMLYRVVHDQPDLAGLPDELLPVVQHCLAKNPAARPQPRELSRLLSPGGAPAALADGWLPTRVASAIASHAARVMNLDSPAAAPSPAPPAAPTELGTMRLGALPPSVPTDPPTPGRRTLLASLLGVAVVGGTGFGAWELTNSPRTRTSSHDGAVPGSPAPSTRVWPSHAPGIPPAPLWTYHGQKVPNIPAVAGGGRVLVSGGTVTALDPAGGGAVTWTLQGQPNAAEYPPFVLSGSTVAMVVRNEDLTSSLVAYSTSDGQEQWRTRGVPGSGLSKVLAADASTIYLRVTGGAVAVDRTTHQPTWSQPWADFDDDYGQVLVTGTTLLRSSRAGSAYGLVAHDARTGNVRWTYPFRTDDLSSSHEFTADDRNVYLAGAELVALNLTTGQTVLTLPNPDASDGFGSAVVHDSVIYAAEATNRTRAVYAINATDGKQLWRTTLPTLTTDHRQPLVIGAVLFFAAFDGFFALDRATGRLLWTFSDTARPGTPWRLSSDGTLLYALHGDTLYALPPE
ncbi:PQQ-binding-like beta-propeller repeat protein [Kitasatospora sp. NPDC101155]|uniref:serine/threonine-protein kinase n=1 Tax=Kitasatospora sp. NPDC101155 TaxID=3364097 RepID=UPI0038205AC3